MDILQVIQRFLPRGEKPLLLLGFSGGGDSLALLHALLRCPVQLHLAHFDHGWRTESRDQAESFAQMAKELKIPFFTERSRSPVLSEDAARQERLAFFSKLYSNNPYTALVLGHHGDDQAETVLKRAFEGAHLSSLGGMRPISTFEGMSVWRPLLGISKQDIEHWLKKNQLQGIEDHTNKDERYLRARMRGSLFPELEQHFGKGIKKSLMRIGKYAHELSAYLEKRTAPYYSTLVEGPFGVMWDFSSFDYEPIEWRYVLKKFFGTLSEEVITCLMELLKGKVAGRKIILKEGPLLIDRGILFLPALEKPRWEVTLKPCIEAKSSHWKDLWQGRGQIGLPGEEFELIEAKKHLPYPGNSPIDKWWTAHKVPAFLRSAAPLVRHKGEVVGEFLTGKNKRGNCKFCLCIQVEKTR